MLFFQPHLSAKVYLYRAELGFYFIRVGTKQNNSEDYVSVFSLSYHARMPVFLEKAHNIYL